MEQLKKAIEIATKYHNGQKRIWGEDYIEHPLRVMRILQELCFDEEVLIAAVLHDVCEDTAFSNREVLMTFGEHVGFIVNTLSKNKKPSDEEIKKLYKQEKPLISLKNFYNDRFLLYINRLLRGIKADPNILFIKISDQIDNLSTLDIFLPQKQKRKIKEMEEYFLPLYEKACEDLSPELKKRYDQLMNRLENVIEKNRERLENET